MWFIEDVKQILVAVDSSNSDIARHINTPEMALYRAGFAGALKAAALAFGIDDWPSPTNSKAVTR